MPNILDATGLTVKTRDELIAEWTANFKTIYGNDINLDSDSPDGQIMNDFVQSYLDLQDFLVQIYNSFDPDNAIGVILDQRVALNGIQREAGTFSLISITVVTSQALALYGLDQTDNPIFTVQDNNGQQWQLSASQSPSGSGSYTYQFQAANPGAIQAAPSTITIPVTIILGVTSVNNASAQSVLGINEETDFQLKVRRQRSVSIPSQGYLNGLIAALENINGMTSAFVYENNTDSTDANNVPSHSIWVITAGTAASVDIAKAIYSKRNAGCGMYGATSYNVLQVDGTLFTVSWDVVVTLPLFAKFTWNSLDGVNVANISRIISQLAMTFIPSVNETVDINELATKVQAADPNVYITSAGFSGTAGGSYTNTKVPTTKANQFLSPTIIALPIVVAPYNSVTAAHLSVPALGTIKFTNYGGYGNGGTNNGWAIHTNNSGGSISSAGLYTAGATPSVTDTIRFTDSLGNTSDALVDVTT